MKTTHIRGNRPGFWVYATLGVVFVSAAFPLYWSFIIGSGDASSLRERPWLPGGNFIDNAIAVMSNPAVNFWAALWNSIYSSFLIASAVVITSTLAGWAFAKLKFPGGPVLLGFVVATMAVPQQLGVVPLYILFSELGWTGQIGAIIVPALTSAFGVFWMTQYLRQAVPNELIEAARVDGASMIRTFWTVGVVAARPAAAMLFLLKPDASGSAFTLAVELLCRLLDSSRRSCARDDTPTAIVHLCWQATGERHYGRGRKGLIG
jgi:cellobiose transport system permease protein